jgi:hypothetical protein
MKIAYLITAHNQPAHLHRMIEALNNSDTAFFIHIDAKSDLNSFSPQSYPENVTFIENRVKVHHGGYSLVIAMVNLIKCALNQDAFDYFQFLSGWDYPIKSRTYIHEFLNQSYPTNFINFYRLTPSADFYENISKYYFIDEVGNSPHLMQKPLKAIQYLISNASYDRPFFDDMIPYRGSTWFCLNKATMYYIYHYLQTEKGKCYLEYFRKVLCGDEIFFQTLVLNSPFAEFCRFYDRDRNTTPRNENKAYLHYIDWDQKRENPAVFDLTDLTKLLASDALYARKFTEKKSARLLDELDRLTETVHAL